MSQIPTLLRRFALDWIGRADSGAATGIMSETYRLGIGSIELDGRDAYVAATAGQLEIFPGLLLTVHDVAVGEEWGALSFTEHGPSARHGLAPAAWRGVAIFWAEGGVFTRCVTEEDYLSRKRQLAERAVDRIAPPMAAPWATASLPPDPAAEATLRELVGDKGLSGWDGVRVDDGTPLEGVASAKWGEVVLTACESAGPKVAFRGSVPCVLENGEQRSMTFAGLVDVVDGEIRGGSIVRDRLGLRARRQA